MFRKLSTYTLVTLLGLAAASCNSDPQETTVSTYESTVVEGFALAANDKVLANLDSVFFSIDLKNAKIYNADSLPKGTDVSKLLVNISTSNVAGVELIVNRGAQGDTIYNYLSSQKDSIDFTRPVTLKITAQSGITRNYEVKVNVHTIDPDSLFWSETALTALPSLLKSPVTQKTVEFNGDVVTLTADAEGNGCVAVSENPAMGWESKRVTLPAGVNVRTFAATKTALYVLDNAGALYTCNEPGAEWTPTGAKMASIIGGYESTLLGIEINAAGTPVFASFPAGEVKAADVPADFPVSGSSTPLSYSSKWTPSTTVVIAGGLNAAGEPVRSTWAFDGSEWARISADVLPAAEGMTLIPYFAFRTAANWVVTEETVVLAMGGRKADGSLNRAVYISRDRGINWRPAATTFALPDYIPSFAFADAVVVNTEMTTEPAAAALWQDMPAMSLPRWWKMAAPDSRAVTAVTEWECPYIYLFGGTNADGQLRNTVWRGVINRLYFTPLY